MELWMEFLHEQAQNILNFFSLHNVLNAKIFFVTIIIFNQTLQILTINYNFL